jgi:hypothetical protein
MPAGPRSGGPELQRRLRRLRRLHEGLNPEGDRRPWFIIIILGPVS